MADTNQSRRADFLDDDPFAELTRIMGHDPREPRGEEPAQPVAEVVDLSHPEDDFDVDLEKELVGELDFSEFEEPRPEADLPVVDEPVEATDDAAWAAPEAVHVEPETGFAETPEIEPDAPSAGFAPVEAAAEPAFDADDFGSALERELFGGQDEPSFEAPPANEPAAYEAAAEEPVAEEPVAFEPFEEAVAEVADAELDLSFLEEDIARDAAPVAEAAPSAETEPAAEYEPVPTWDSELVEEADEPQVEDEAETLPPQDAGFDAEPVSYHAAEPAAYEPASWEPVDEAAFEPVKQPFFSAPEPAEPSLEDELSALLSGDEPAPAAVAAPSAREDDWRPAVDTFGRANLTAVADEPALPAWEPSVPAEAEAYAPQDAAPHAGPESDDFADIFGDDFALEVEEQPAAQPEPEEPASPPVAAAATGLAALSQWLPRSGQPAAAPAEAPEVETVDVAEAAPAVVDDLDIPDVDYASPEPRAYDELDDIEAEFAQAFGDFSPAEEPRPEYAPAAASAAAAHDEAPFDAYALGEGEWQAGEQPADDGFDYETDLEHAIAMSAYEDDVADRPASRKRGLMVAALVAGVALIGGAGVFGMSFFGGGSDGPAVVRADTDPMKVRPENPGGTTVPNQDSQAYARVAGGQQETAPGQERLISTAEEPVDVAAQAQPPALAPGVSDESAEELAEEDTAALDAAPKSEERLDPADTAPVTAAAEEVAAVAPRRVRTMVVRPDGTLVPREEPAPAAAAPAEQPDETVLAAAPTLAAPALAPANAPQIGDVQQQDVVADEEVAAIGEEDDGPVVETPPTVAVVPSRRVEPQAAAAAPVAQPAVQQPVAQQPAATPVSAPAAAAPAGAGSEWSMQIASQPTAEGAQATYQDLARRYGGVLEGRGVNIVRANIEGMGTYYRVRIPASSRDEAIQLCTRYKAAGGSCFVSR